VLHFDENVYYGDAEASLNVDELHSWANSTIGVVCEGVPPPGSRAFSISLCPTIIPATGPLINALIQSGVSRYTSFKLLDDISIFTMDVPSVEGEQGNQASSSFKSVPISKAAIFKSSMSLLQKRKLTRLIQMLTDSESELKDKPRIQGKESISFVDFLTAAPSQGGGFGLERDIAEAIGYCLGFCESLSGERHVIVRDNIVLTLIFYETKLFLL
jgi:RAB protein geranylgeranyltransferase component A